MDKTYIKTFQDFFLNRVKDVTRFGDFIVLFVLLLFIPLVHGKIIFIILGMVCVELLVVLIKWAYFKERPKKKKYDNWIEKIDASSFPSGHTARTTFVCLVLYTSFHSYIQWFALLLIIGVFF